MFSANIIRTTKAAKAMKKHGKLRMITSLFRVLEICLVLTLLSRFSINIPSSFRVYGEYFKDLPILLVSPHFVFVLGNVIVIILFAKSRPSSGKSDDGKSSKADLYKEFAENKEKQGTCFDFAVNEDITSPLLRHHYRRSQSEKFEVSQRSERSCKQLGRSMTEMRKEESGFENEMMRYSVDKMSNEEFRCAIEAFIAKQKRFSMYEENSVFQ